MELEEPPGSVQCEINVSEATKIDYPREIELVEHHLNRMERTDNLNVHSYPYPKGENWSRSNEP